MLDASQTVICIDPDPTGSLAVPAKRSKPSVHKSCCDVSSHLW